MTQSKEQPDRAAALIAGEERRRSHRVIIRVPVALEVMISGQKVTASGYTVAVNIHGAMVVCPRPFDADTELEIVNQSTRERASARVTRSPRESAEGYLIPVEFSTQTPTFWQFSFPPATWKPSDSCFRPHRSWSSQDSCASNTCRPARSCLTDHFLYAALEKCPPATYSSVDPIDNEITVRGKTRNQFLHQRELI